MMTTKKQQEVVIENRIAQICEERGIDREEFRGLALLSKASIRGRRLTAETAGRVYDGETSITLETASLVAAALGLPLERVFKIEAR